MLSVRGVSYLVDAAGPEACGKDLAVIASELHCNAVMLIGRDRDRLLSSAQVALALGLAVYLRPDMTDLRRQDMLDHLATVAEGAEALRAEHPDRVVLLVGSEFSHTVAGVVPGPRSFIRLWLIVRYRRLLKNWMRRRLLVLLARSAVVARHRFRGPLGYSAAAWEEVDWTVFDLVGVSLYRSAGNRVGYLDRLRALVDDQGRPLLITEFGCGAFAGAAERGAGSFQIVNWFADPPMVRSGFARDESVQAGYVSDLIDLFDNEGVHGCFVFTYAMPGYPHSDDPRYDLDRAGFGLVAVDEAGPKRKQAFHAVAERFHDLDDQLDDADHDFDSLPHPDE